LVLLSQRVSAGVGSISSVEEAAMQWMVVFEREENILELESLLSGFALLAFSLCKYASTFTLLENLFSKYCERSDDPDSNPVARVVASLLGTRSLTTDTVNCFFDASRLLLHDGGASSLQSPHSIDDLFIDGKGCTRSAFKAILSNKLAGQELAKRIIVAFDTKELEREHQLFCAKCLFVLSDARNSKFAPEIGIIARGLDVEATSAPDGVKAILEALVAGAD
jgi:hypothetical protein